MEPWVWAIIVPAVIAVIGAFWALIRRGLDKLDTKVSEHGERIAVLESESITTKAEVKAIREMRHDILDNVSKSLASWYISIMERINK